MNEEAPAVQREELDLYEHANEILRRMANGGVLCTVCDGEGRENLLTLGWGQVGRSYRRNPMFAIAVTPLRYSWRGRVRDRCA